MHGIQIVVLLVRCSADLLLCEGLPTRHLQFATIEDCRTDAAALMAGGRRTQSRPVLMADCRYVLKNADPDRRAIRAPGEALAATGTR